MTPSERCPQKVGRRPDPQYLDTRASCGELVSGYLELAGDSLPVCGKCARAFVAIMLEMGFLPEIAGHIAGELRERGLPRHVVEALERRKQRLMQRTGK